MSWKSFVSAGLLCILASPAFAAPTMTVTNQGLNAAGNWVWRVHISPSNPIPTGGTPLAAELGFRETAALAELLSATNLSTGAGDDFDTANPGNVIFGWETLSDTDTPPDGIVDDPVGLQTNLATDEVFSALGSQLYTTTGPKDYIDIVVSRPVATSATDAPAKRTTSIQWLGDYSGNGRIAEMNAAGTTSVNYDTYSGSVTRTATPGDTNLTGGVGLADFNTVLGQLGAGTRWQDGNFDNVGTTGLADFNTVLGALGLPSGGGGSGGGSAIPEPATAALMGLGILSVLGLASRRRK